MKTHRLHRLHRRSRGDPNGRAPIRSPSAQWPPSPSAHCHSSALRNPATTGSRPQPTQHWHRSEQLPRGILARLLTRRSAAAHERVPTRAHQPARTNPAAAAARFAPRLVLGMRAPRLARLPTRLLRSPRARHRRQHLARCSNTSEPDPAVQRSGVRNQYRSLKNGHCRQRDSNTRMPGARSCVLTDRPTRRRGRARALN